MGLQGGQGRIGVSSGVPVRKAAVGVLTGLVKAWLWPGGLTGVSPGPNPGPMGGNNTGGSEGNSRSPTPVLSVSSSGVSGSGLSIPPPVNLSEALWVFLRDQALGSILSALTDGHSVDVRDAATQSLLVEVGGLIWTLQLALSAHAATPPLVPASCTTPMLHSLSLPVYLGQLLPLIGWPSHAVNTLQQIVSAINNSPSPTPNINNTSISTTTTSNSTVIPLGTFKETFRKFVRSAVSS